ncbi:DUF6691 family protein [Elioraea sp.]|uniref:DUF6691 family protein n=1 Tax=Elioraea sp. TaxID=2185103 RepID=UPI0025BB2C7B|nr:DUF6691 family protein [Elioraea sp.]
MAEVVGTGEHADAAATLKVRTMVQGAVFGFVFGFLLQKGGVGTYHILVGQLLFQDWTVVKIMLSAIVVGMVGVFALHHFGKVELHIQPTRLGPNILGGLVFGAGFALIGYCPGTAAAALGQGSWDALFGMAGLVVGSWVYAELSGRLKQTVERWGDLGKLTLDAVLHVPRKVLVPTVAGTLVVFLIVLNALVER